MAELPNPEIFDTIPTSRREYDALLHDLIRAEAHNLDPDEPDAIMAAWAPLIGGAIIACSYAERNDLSLQKPYITLFEAIASRGEALTSAGIALGDTEATKQAVHDTHSANMHLYDMHAKGLLGADADAALILCRSELTVLETVTAHELVSSSSADFNAPKFTSELMDSLRLYEVYDPNESLEDMRLYLRNEGEEFIVEGLEEDENSRRLLMLGTNALQASLYIQEVQTQVEEDLDLRSIAEESEILTDLIETAQRALQRPH